MSSRTINRLVQILTILAVVYILVLFGQSRRTTPGAAMPAAVTGVKTAADKLVINTGTDTIELQREGAKWFIGKKAVSKVKSDAVLTALEDIEFIRIVSAKGDDAQKYGVADGAKSVGVFQGARNLRTIVIGPGVSMGRFFARLAGKPAIYEAEGDLSMLVDQPVSQWIEDTPEAKKK